MRRLAACTKVAASALACCAALLAQTTQSTTPQGATPPAEVLLVREGENLVLELRDPLNTKTTRKGDVAHLKTTNEVLVDGRVAIPRETTVRAEVVEAKRAGRLSGRAKLKLEFREVILADGTSLPLSAVLTRAGWWDPSGKGEPGSNVGRVAQGAMQGAIFGAIVGALGAESPKGAARDAAAGAIAGATISAIAILLERGPDLDLPPGMLFEVELAKLLEVPVAAVNRSLMASRESQPEPADSPETPSPAEAVASNQPTTETPATSTSPQTPTQEAATPKPQPTETASAPAVSDTNQPPAEPTTVAANRTTPPPPPAPVPVDPSLGAGTFKLKVDVQLVLVEATVRDERGGIVNNLKREDFRVLENGVEHEISHFSRDEHALAVALVVDRSGSIAPVIQELRGAAYETLSLLKPEDQVALFAFAASPERLENLTTDRDRIADGIARIQAGGGTNISDALFDAVLYLGRAAPTRRHAVILVSDNQGTVRGYAGDNEVIRLALETETVIYSIKVGSPMHGGLLGFPDVIPMTGSVKKMTRETGGEVIDAGRSGSVGSAMAAVIARLKQRYTLGYPSADKRQDGSFRKIDVRLSERLGPSRGRYTIYARRGYYARLERPASTSRTP